MKGIFYVQIQNQLLQYFKAMSESYFLLYEYFHQLTVSALAKLLPNVLPRVLAQLYVFTLFVQGLYMCNFLLIEYLKSEKDSQFSCDFLSYKAQKLYIRLWISFVQGLSRNPSICS